MSKNKYRLIAVAYIISLMFLQSCIKDRYTALVGIAYNNSSQPVDLLYYRNGIVNSGDSIRLNVNDTVVLGRYAEEGDVAGPLFFSDHYLGPKDSLVIVFGGIYKVAHYVEIDTPKRSKHYVYTQTRNMNNISNWEFEKQRSKTLWINYHRYYFTEADYNYAKD